MTSRLADTEIEAQLNDLYAAVPASQKVLSSEDMPVMPVSSSLWGRIIFFILSVSLFDTASALPANTSSPVVRPFVLPPPKQHLSRRHKGRDKSFSPRLDVNFPDPCLVQDQDDHWVSFATSGGGYHIQVAVADDLFGEWTHLQQDALPGDGWTSGRNYWAPDVRKLEDDSYIMYFSGELPEGGHCIGVARSHNSTGPYTMDPKPFACPRDEGGAIDPAGFFDESTNKRYVVYKVDGNALNNGSGTPIRLQEVSTKDGSTPIGKPVDILDRIASEDGPLVEAPSLVRTEQGKYLLFFSSHMYTGDAYDVKWAMSDRVEGPYTRGSSPFLKTPALGLKGPGGGTSSENGQFMVFHAWCGKGKRCMYAIGYGLDYE
ncbi:Uncharacterized protein HZ326_5768 [Fusarium oxysporum f. sp. albedinis]|nr:Uncharacterized protein HZ326_5768 [Fusarium oxysporum f. sp. albedinis]KAK2481091.1 hypothetical protein H9L39_06730 [Fusarium oxysporum f. sp. albedinis]